MREQRAAQNYYGTVELAAVYDDDCAGRRDLGFYVALARRLNPRTIIDLGAGTGLLASMLAETGFEVIAVEPQATMLKIADRQPHADDVTWVHGTAADLAPLCADLVLMTGHVAQYFLDDAAWLDLLTNVRRVLRPGGRLGFEIRNRATESWRSWATSKPRPTSRGTIEQSVRQTGDLVTHVDEYLLDGTRWITSETLRFPDWHSVADGLQSAGFELESTWGDWDESPITERSPEWIILASTAKNDHVARPA
ncbi:SAM-dependent methyltransferase [Nakamurella sp. UYEF19]|uniref:class I SAM-dependent methyltransferase n=1 Tax=Nakamurella sp. UYEF19 TaxID=1756392 RepID=UPI0033979F98